MPADLDAVREVFRRASLSKAGDQAALLAHPEVLLWPADAIAEGRTRVAVADDGTIADVRYGERRSIWRARMP